MKLEELLKVLENEQQLLVKENTTTKYKPKEIIQEVLPKQEKWTIEEMRNLIGCKYIKIVHLSDKKSMVVDEEGMLNNKEINDYATFVLRTALKQLCQPIVGNVLIINSNSIE